MLDPQGLYEWEPSGLAAVEAITARDSAGLVLLYHFDGYIDAGETGDQIVDRLLGGLSHRVVARFDHDRLVDYRARRPLLTFQRHAGPRTRPRASSCGSSRMPPARRSCCCPARSRTWSGSASRPRYGRWWSGSAYGSR